MLIKLLIIILIIYIVSFIYVYKCIQKNHSKGGIWEGCNPDRIDLIFTIIPFVNTISMIVYFFEKSKEYPSILHKFYRIKRN